MKILHTKSTNALLTLIKFICITVFGSSVILTFAVSAEDTDSLSSELFKQVGDDAFWEVEVKCEGDFDRVVIRQKLKQNDWCIESAKISCEKTKQKMAEQVCLNIQTLAEPRPVTPVVTAQQPQQLSTAAVLSAEAKKASQARQLARIKVEQKARQERDRLALASALNEEQLVLREARVILDQEKLEVELMEAELDSQAREIERQLQSLEN